MDLLVWILSPTYLIPCRCVFSKTVLPFEMRDSAQVHILYNNSLFSFYVFLQTSYDGEYIFFPQIYKYTKVNTLHKFNQCDCLIHLNINGSRPHLPYPSPTIYRCSGKTPFYLYKINLVSLRICWDDYVVLGDLTYLKRLHFKYCTSNISWLFTRF